MAHGSSKMSKIKCMMMKKWQLFAKNTRKSTCSSEGSTLLGTNLRSRVSASDFEGCKDEGVPEGFEAVLVGKSRRRYVISANFLNHPLLRSLVEKSELVRGSNPTEEPALTISCEVVLFEHLLWMLENGDPALAMSDSLEELVELYAS